MKAQWLNKREKLTKQLPSSKSWNLTIKYAEWFVLESKKKDKIGQEIFFFFLQIGGLMLRFGGWEAIPVGSESVSKKKKKSSKGNKGFFRGWVFEMKKMKFCCYVFGFWVFKCKSIHSSEAKNLVF